MNFLVSYYPLICNAMGKLASKKYNLPPYIDGSCRREPDFEHEMPAITGLCRPGFSNKLNVGDKVIYVTNLAGLVTRKFVAVLEVVHVCKNHKDAAKWYNENGHDLPNNIMFDGNKHIELDKTHQMMGWNSWVANCHTVECWNKGYEDRSKSAKSSHVAICEHWFKEYSLTDPRSLTKEEFYGISGMTQGNRNYKILSTEQFEFFRNWLNRHT